MNFNEILVHYGTDYIAMTLELLEEADLKTMILSKCKEKNLAVSEIKIAVKPNLVAPVMAEEGATTHPEVVEGILRYLQNNGFSRISIMESSWVGDRSEDAFSLCGFYRLAEKYGVPVVDVKKEPAVVRDCAGMELKIGEAAANTDFLINVPVLKGHCQTRMTCCLKNMKGLLPDSQKRAFHRMGLHDPIGHLSAGIHQDFILIDSICGDLSFEDGGHPVQQDRLIAACDPVLADTYCAGLLDIPVEEIPYIGIAAECGCGSMDISQAVIRELAAPVHPAVKDGVRRAVRLSEFTREVDACSACFGSLIPALAQLEEEGGMPALLEFLHGEKIAVGQGNKGKCGFAGIGNCTRGYEYSLKGCPPEKEEILEWLKTLQ